MTSDKWQVMHEVCLINLNNLCEYIIIHHNFPVIKGPLIAYVRDGQMRLWEQ